MITVEALVDSTPMFQSLSEKSQHRFKQRLGKKLHRHFSRSQEITAPLDDDFLSCFEVTPDNAKKVMRLISGVISFSWLALIFGPFWAAHKRVPLFVGIHYLFLICFPLTLLFSMDAYVKLWDLLMPNLPILICVMAGMTGRAVGVQQESMDIIESRFGLAMISRPDRWMTKALGSNHRWIRVMIFTIAMVVIQIMEHVIGSSLHGAAFTNFDPFAG